MEFLSGACEPAPTLQVLPDGSVYSSHFTNTEDFWRVRSLVSSEPKLQRLDSTIKRVRIANQAYPDLRPSIFITSEIACPPGAPRSTTPSKPLTLRSHRSSHSVFDTFIESHTRSLTFKGHEADDIMTTVSSAPSSPPELACSRSSKSSSVCSSSTFSSPDGVASDITNFEDIELEDEKRTGQETPTRTNGAIYNIYTKPLNRTESREERANTRPRRPSLKNQIAAVVHDSQSITPGLRRGFTSPPTSISAVPALMSRQRFRSPVPENFASKSTTSLPSHTNRPHSFSATSRLTVPNRRASWQTRRRSAQELEAEYHDSDDDLPDDASLWNVPVSPFVTSTRSQQSSPGISPHRSPTSGPRPIPLDHAKTLPEAAPHHIQFSRSLPKTRQFPQRTTSLGNSFSNPSSPRFAQACNPRSKSWNFALADLSEEARIIGEKLDHYVEVQEVNPLERVKPPRPRSGLEDLGRTKTHEQTIQLPPIQKGNLDFMPFSKEKEAVLSRTRPSWLPPKDPKEERRHLKEYQQMMAASMEADKKKRTRAQLQRCEKDDTQQALTQVWTYYLSSAADDTVTRTQASEACWRGIIPQMRSKVWPRVTGNSLGLLAQSYEKARQRVKEIRQKPEESISDSEKRLRASFVDIERDAETAFPELNLFQRQGPLWQDLIDVCEAYACYRGDIGYVYGVQLIAATILLQDPSALDAFILLANLLNKTTPLAFHTGDRSSTSRTYNHAVSSLATKFPRLHEYLFGSVEQGGLGMSGQEIFQPMFQSLFCNGLDVERLCRIWDVWMFDGDRILVQCATAILGSLQAEIFDVCGTVDLKRRNIQEMLGWGPFNRTRSGGYWNLTTAGGVDTFMEAVRDAGTLDYTGR